MDVPARGLKSFRIYLEMIKIEHSIFALPFAMIGMIWGSLFLQQGPWPGWEKFLWIVAAMVSMRSAAMAFNRIADRDIDAVNPRTRMRAIPSGLLQLRQANLFFAISIAIFFVAAAMLNTLALILAPEALIVTLGYSLTKRFTPLSHFILGLSLGIAPAAAFLGVSGALNWPIVAVSAGVALWTAGFDIIYSLQDEEFDREHKLRSLPQTVGKAKALQFSRICHIGAVLCLLWAGIAFLRGPFWHAGVIVAGAVLAYEQSLVKPNDLSKVNVAFFTLNGLVSIAVFVFALIDVLI